MTRNKQKACLLFLFIGPIFNLFINCCSLDELLSEEIDGGISTSTGFDIVIAFMQSSPVKYFCCTPDKDDGGGGTVVDVCDKRFCSLVTVKSSMVSN